MSAELLNCPFCGAHAQYDPLEGEWVGCRNMECSMHGTSVSIETWNTRTPDLSFLDKPEVVEAAYQALKGEWTYFPTTEDEWKTAIETAIAAIKRMAKGVR